jgi:multiple sugar transport system ATP-binding protein
MRAEIAQLHRRLGSTFVYVTHDQAEAMTMSGRIAVMIGGELVQVGRPADVYDNPRDLRVAEFVGSPKINVFPGEILSDGRVEVLDRPTGVRTSSPRGSCRVAVRPERITLGGDGAFAGTVVHVENMGAEAFVHLGCDGLSTPIVARLDDSSRLPALGIDQRFGFRPDAVRAFDATGRRIETVAPSAERLREITHV